MKKRIIAMVLALTVLATLSAGSYFGVGLGGAYSYRVPSLNYEEVPGIDPAFSKYGGRLELMARFTFPQKNFAMKLAIYNNYLIDKIARFTPGEYITRDAFTFPQTGYILDFYWMKRFNETFSLLAGAGATASFNQKSYHTITSDGDRDYVYSWGIIYTPLDIHADIGLLFDNGKMGMHVDFSAGFNAYTFTIPLDDIPTSNTDPAAQKEFNSFIENAEKKPYSPFELITSITVGFSYRFGRK